MHVSAELRTRRLVAVLLILATLPLALAMVAATYRPPEEPPPGPSSYNPLPLPKSPVLDAIRDRELSRSERYATAAEALEAPTLLGSRSPGSLPTLVLPPRPDPYGLKELQQLVPAAFGSGETALVVQAGIVVVKGSALTITASETPEVRLASRADGFAWIVSSGGVVDLVGSEGTPLRITSWDDSRAAPDENPDDGRAFVLSRHGVMNMTWADVGYLGFGTGVTSGMAWKGTAEVGDVVPAYSGAVGHSTMHHNWFGAYTFAVQRMRWTDNTFADNQAYGFDPHDFSDGFLVENNVARNNGRHGFIFSRGCSGNMLRNNVAYGNRGHGFMIDDGRSADAELGRGPVASNGNQLVGNWAHDNGGSGIEIEGGSGNVLQDNVLERNHVGIRIKDGASAAIRRNVITGNRLFGVHVFRDLETVEVTDNDIDGAWAGIAFGSATSSTVHDNEVTGGSVDRVVDGITQRHNLWGARVRQLYRRKPVLLLWTVVLGAPVLAGEGRRLVRALRRSQPEPAMP